ncbi:hypothetical protein POREN0001_1431 [Porphyromonas endodontalis ATCC 35406]|uniref:Uncharacterized protein n=1 Tax=Porphyromonas endodontalis (strain ATCC 35406 / DSM 24491 / JCM 8526 / CCUG 16442 / BCRC 14492 / NCTC 13058 / HG 370) TaxID=553175 RepID=C3J8Z6_POREA|nr:hypothetical protein POREN0001_1431 [Porphyromonas endodontalis ATCC 35406]
MGSGILPHNKKAKRALFDRPISRVLYSITSLQEKSYRASAINLRHTLPHGSSNLPPGKARATPICRYT